MLLVESGDNGGPFQRIILAEFVGQKLRIVDVIERPKETTTNVEGTAVAQIEDRLIFVYAERAQGSASTDIMFADLELDPLNIIFDDSNSLGTFTNPDWPRTNRPATAMDVDSGGWLYVASAFDPGNDNWPFRSVVWTDSGKTPWKEQINPVEGANLPGRISTLLKKGQRPNEIEDKSESYS